MKLSSDSTFSLILIAFVVVYAITLHLNGANFIIQDKNVTLIRDSCGQNFGFFASVGECCCPKFCQDINYSYRTISEYNNCICCETMLGRERVD